MVSDLRHCRNGHEVPGTASLCPTCGDGGSLRDAEGSGDKPVRGWVWVVVGLLVTGLGRLMWTGAGPEDGGEALVGGLLWILGIVVAGVGVVAEGVLVGMRRWQHGSGRPVR